jgi:multiple sugar transport system permease protein
MIESIHERRRHVIKLILTVLIATIASLVIYPFLWMISASFKKPIDIFSYPVQWIPGYWYPDNYEYVLNNADVLIIYFNSLKVSVISVFGAGVTSFLAAYGFTKLKFPGRDFLFLVMISTLMIPAQVTFVPRFAMFTWLKLIDTHWALILPGMLAVFGTFLLRQFLLQIPNSLSEAARIDGAGDFTICWKIMFPIAKPAIATFIIIVFSHHWNDYETPLIFIRSRELYTIPLALASFNDETGVMYHYVMALTAVSVIPLFIVFFAFQKYFIQGLTAGSVKG